MPGLNDEPAMNAEQEDDLARGPHRGDAGPFDGKAIGMDVLERGDAPETETFVHHANGTLSHPGQALSLGLLTYPDRHFPRGPVCPRVVGDEQQVLRRRDVRRSLCRTPSVVTRVQLAGRRRACSG